MLHKKVKGIKTYTADDIVNWHLELQQIPQRINVCENNIRHSQEQLDTLVPSLDALIQTQLNPTKVNIKNIQAQIDVLVLPDEIASLTKQIIPHQNKLNELRPELEDKNKILTPLNKEISRLENLIKLVKNQESLSRLEPKLREENQQLSRAESAQRDLQAQQNTLSINISNTDSELSRLISAQAFDNLNHTFNHHHHHNHNGGYSTSQHPSHSSGYSIVHGITDGIHTVNDIARSSRISSLREALRQFRIDKASIDSQVGQAEKVVGTHKQQVRNLQQEIDNHHSQIRRLNRELEGQSSYVSSLSNLEIELDQKHKEKRPLENRRIELEQKIHFHSTKKRGLKLTLDNQQKTLDEARIIVSKLPENKDLQNLKNQLEYQTEIKKKLLMEKSNYETTVAYHRDTISSERTEIANHRKKQDTLRSNDYIAEFLTNPQTLLNDLIQRIQINFADYEKQHPAEQHAAVRMCLADISNKIHAITTQPIEMQLYGVNAAKSNPDAIRYYQLSGLLWSMYDKLNSTEPGFCEYILKSLGKNALDSAESQKEYISFRDASYVNHEMTESEEFTYSSVKYTEAYDAIKQTLLHLDNQYKQQSQKHKEVRDFIDEGKKVWNLIDSKVKKAIKAGDVNFDLKFHINLLNQTNLVLQKPQDPTLIRDYKALATHIKDGKRSLCKQISGAMMAFAGAAVAVVSAVAEFFTLPVPFTKPVTYGGMFGGGTLFAAGVALFRNGREKGVKKEVENFTNAAQRSALTLWQPQERTEIQTPTQQAVLPQQTTAEIKPVEKKKDEPQLQYADYSMAPSAPRF